MHDWAHWREQDQDCHLQKRMPEIGSEVTKLFLRPTVKGAIIPVDRIH